MVAPGVPMVGCWWWPRWDGNLSPEAGVRDNLPWSREFSQLSYSNTCNLRRWSSTIPTETSWEGSLQPVWCRGGDEAKSITEWERALRNIVMMKVGKGGMEPRYNQMGKNTKKHRDNESGEEKKKTYSQSERHGHELREARSSDRTPGRPWIHHQAE